MITERATLIFLKKIFNDYDPDFLDIRSPCGAGIGQIAYNFDGSIFSCDEARMLSRMGDNSFKLGDVDTPLAEMLNSPPCKTMIISSTLNNIPGCSDCAYSPYCGICPIFNYIETKSVFARPELNDRSRLNKMRLDYIFEKLSHKKTEQTLKSWLNQASKKTA